MDAFYASVEELEQPELKDIPFAVGGMAMLSTSNYLARKFGVRSAMPGFIGMKLCPHLKIVKPHYDKYRDISNKVRKVFMKYDPNFSPMSLDEVKKKDRICICGVIVSGSVDNSKRSYYYILSIL